MRTSAYFTKRPATSVSSYETEHLASFLQNAMLNGWGGYVLTEANDVDVFFIHDDYIDFFAQRSNDLNDVRQELRRDESAEKRGESPWHLCASILGLDGYHDDAVAGDRGLEATREFAEIGCRPQITHGRGEMLRVSELRPTDRDLLLGIAAVE
jgi:hypothetical protein